MSNNIINSESYVVKHNKLIELKGKMTALEQKLLSTVISSIKPNDQDFKEYRIDVNEFAKCMESKHKDFYTQLKETASSLRDRKIEIEKITKKGKSFLVTGWISSAQYVEGEGELSIYIDPNLKPYLLELKEKFTQYPLKYILKLKGTHSIRVYELLKQYEKIGRREFELEKLKNFLGLEGEYDRIYDFERYVLQPAKKEINEHTDLYINYEKIKKSRRVIGIKFIIEGRIDEAQALLEELYSPQEIDEIKIKCGLKDEKFNIKQIMELYEIAVKKTEYENIDPYDYIKLNYWNMIEKGTARNKFAWLKKALEEDYASAILQIRFDTETA